MALAELVGFANALDFTSGHRSPDLFNFVNAVISANGIRGFDQCSREMATNNYEFGKGYTNMITKIVSISAGAFLNNSLLCSVFGHELVHILGNTGEKIANIFGCSITAIIREQGYNRDKKIAAENYYSIWIWDNKPEWRIFGDAPWD